jgi:hypothetical protein
VRRDEAPLFTKGDLMKLLFSALTASALTLALAPAQATTVHHHYVHHVHVVHYYHHHHYVYAGAPAYAAPPPGYYPPPYYAPGVYTQGYFYAAPWEYLGNRNTLKALIDSEWDPPFSGR